MKVVRAAAALAAAFLLVFAGCSDNDIADRDAAPAPGEVVSVLTDVTLEHLTVAPGTTVTWTNEDAQYHTITSGTREDVGRLWDSGTLKRGMSFSFTFRNAGTYPYFCTLHPLDMGGSVTVTAAVE